MATAAAVLLAVFAEASVTLRQLAYILLAVSFVLGIIGLLLDLTLGHRRRTAAQGQSGLFVVQGEWRKTYRWKGSERVETALIRESGYYVEGEHEPHFWLRNVVFDPKTRKLCLEMVLALDGRHWDTEQLTLSPDRRSMSGRSEMTGSEIWYERSIEDTGLPV